MRPVYHIVSHSHWDREWYKTFEQFRAMLVNMVDDLLEILRRDPSYVCFTLDGQTVVLDDYLAVRPEREPELRALVESGRLTIGPWYVLPDEFLVSAEATVRNLMTGMKRAAEFGGGMRVGYIPDSFGHIAMMPAILRGVGIDCALVYRGFGGEPGEDRSEYWWSAPDGSRVLLTHLFRHGYSGGYFHGESGEQAVAHFRQLQAELDARATTSQRLLLNGGDHHWPDPELPAVIETLRRSVDAEIIHSSLPRYMDAVKAEVNGLREITGELRFGYRYAFVVTGGVYSSRMYIKQENWKAQNLLQRYMEPLNALGVMAGMRSQQPLVRHAWRTLMQNHPHDSICGCSLDAVHREMMTRFKAVNDIGHAVIGQALERLVPSDDQAAGDDRSIHLFNPSAFARTDVAQTELNFYLQDIVVGLNPDVQVAPKLPPVGGFRLRNASGEEVPYQIIGRREWYDITYTNYNYPRQTYADSFSLLVDARDVPPLGFARLTVERAQRMPRYRSSSLRCGPAFLENDTLRVEVNRRGEVTLIDRARGTRLRRLNVFEDTGDVGDEYNYSYPKRDLRVVSNRGKARIRLVEKGPLRAALQISLDLSVPAAAAPDRRSRSTRRVRIPITTTLFLTPSSRALEIETVVENRALDHRFRVLFPTGIHTRTVAADSQFCVVAREQKNHDLRAFTIEHPAKVAPMQRFVTVRDEARGVTLLSSGLPEYELLTDGSGTLALTLLRCVGLLAGEDLITRPGGKAGWHNETPEAQCQGTRTFRYAVLPHSSEPEAMAAVLNEESERFHLPLLPVRRKHEVPLSADGSFLSLSDSRLVLSAVKGSEDGERLIVRVYQPFDAEITALLRCAAPVRRACLATLDEQEGEELPVRNGHEVPIHVRPHGILTVALDCMPRS